MAYYVGTRQFPSVYAAVRYLAANPQPGVSITSAPVQTKPTPSTKSGMFTSPTEPSRTPSINDPVSVSDLLDDIPEMPEDPEEPPRPEDTIAQAFAGWDAFIEQVLQYIEDQASDDIDRVYLAQELRELQDLFEQYEAGEITAEEFLEFEPDFIFDVPGATEYWESLNNAVSQTQTEAPEQVLLNEDEFNEQFPDIDPSEYTESGTWTDPETGIVYVINIPPEIEEPEEEEGGGGGAAEEADKEAEQSQKETEAEQTQKDAEAETATKEEEAAERAQKDADAETLDKEETRAEEEQKETEAEQLDKEAEQGTKDAEQRDKEEAAEQEAKDTAAEESQKEAEAETTRKEEEAAEEASKEAEAETQQKDAAEQQQKDEAAEQKSKDEQAEFQAKEEAEPPVTDIETDDTTGTSADVYAGMEDSIVARQIHEAIINETDPEVRDGLINDWERYTGQQWDDTYLEEDPYEDYEPDVDPPEPVGYVYDEVEGTTRPVYQLPEDGTTVYDDPGQAESAYKEQQEAEAEKLTKKLKEQKTKKTSLSVFTKKLNKATKKKQNSLRKMLRLKLSVRNKKLPNVLIRKLRLKLNKRKLRLLKEQIKKLKLRQNKRKLKLPNVLIKKLRPKHSKKKKLLLNKLRKMLRLNRNLKKLKK